MKTATLGQLLSGETKETPKRIMHEAQIDELALLVPKLVLAFSRFSKGDWVTPRQNSPFEMAGEPHVVIDVPCEPRTQWIEHPFSGLNGVTLDMRVAWVADADGNLGVAWVESFWFDKYVGPPGGRPEQ